MPTLISHTKYGRDYEITERLEAGIELLGTEVKSLRAGQGKLVGAHIIVRGGEAFVIGMQVPAHQVKNAPDGYDPLRTRKLLLTSEQIAELGGTESRKGFTLIPLSIYTKGKKIKLELGIAKGKKTHDRREDIKKREDGRAMRRAMKDAGR